MKKNLILLIGCGVQEKRILNAQEKYHLKALNQK
jgi:hypothetical protein